MIRNLAILSLLAFGITKADPIPYPLPAPLVLNLSLQGSSDGLSFDGSGQLFFTLENDNTNTPEGVPVIGNEDVTGFNWNETVSSNGSSQTFHLGLSDLQTISFYEYCAGCLGPNPPVQPVELFYIIAASQSDPNNVLETSLIGHEGQSVIASDGTSGPLLITQDLVTITPEPGALTGVGLALTGLWAWRRKRAYQLSSERMHTLV